ncbi:retrotransposon protein, putative, ty1-copia subclass [Tanacetum coccineum]|uniref:Retrotransposon protein, putative, ty1-copia subclass n=1 Tax=Tanacetum coccineum TaxID=301880 RepID=A0ABQ5ADH1_9ASTR
MNYGYPKESKGYYFYFPLENKIVVAIYAEFLEKNLISQEVSGRAVELKEIQDEDTPPFENTSKIPMEVEGFEPPQEEVIPVLRFGFAQNLDEPYVYQKASESNVTFLILYVDDIIIMRNHIPSLQRVKSYLEKCFAMKDLGEAAFILGIKIYRERTKRLIGLSQSAYMNKILKRFKMEKSKRGNIPMQERIDLNKTQGASTPEEVKRMQNVTYASNPGEPHWTAVKTILKYLRNTKDMFLIYGTVDWKSSKQSITAMSATEAEYIAASEATMKAVWIKKFISWLGIVPTIHEPIKMFAIIQPHFLLSTNKGFREALDTTIEDTIKFESASY